MILPNYSNPSGRPEVRSYEEERDRFSSVETRNRWVRHSVGDQVIFVFPVERRLWMEPMSVLEVRDVQVTNVLGSCEQQQIRLDPEAFPWADSGNENPWRMSGAFCLVSQR